MIVEAVEVNMCLFVLYIILCMCVYLFYYIMYVGKCVSRDQGV